MAGIGQRCAAGGTAAGGLQRAAGSGHAGAGGHAFPAARQSRPLVPAPAGNPLTGLEDGDYTGKRPVAVTLRTPGRCPSPRGMAAADVLVEGVTGG